MTDDVSQPEQVELSKEAIVYDIPCEDTGRLLQELDLANRLKWGGNRVAEWVFRGQDIVAELKPAAWRPGVVGSKYWSYSRDAAYKYAVAWLEANTRGPEDIPIPAGEWSDAWPTAAKQRQIARDLVQQIHWELMLVNRFADLANEIGLFVGHEGQPLLLPHDEPFAGDVRAREPDQRFAFAQHHLLPTRLLDWTRRPLHALHFAAISCFKREVDAKLGRAILDGGSDTERRICVYAVNLHVLKRVTGELRALRQATCLDDHSRHHRLGIWTYPGIRAGHSYLTAQDGLFTWIPGWEQHFLRYGDYPSIEDAMLELLQRWVAATEKNWMNEFGPPLRRISLDASQAQSLVDLLGRNHVTELALKPTLDNVTEQMKLEAFLPVERGPVESDY